MLLFLILFMPCVLALYCFVSKNKKVAPVIFIGLMVALLYCAVRVIGTFSHRIIPDSFGTNYFYYLIRFTVIPVITIYALYVLLTRDTWEFKISMFFPLLGTFYAVFIPYKVVAFTQSVYSGYDLFLRPMIYMAMIGGLAICLFFAFKYIVLEKIPLAIISIVLIIVYMLIPALFDTLFALNKATAVVICGGLLYSLIPGLYGGYCVVKKMLEK